MARLPAGAARPRRLQEAELVVSDAHGGLVRAIGEVFQGAAWQRCAVHLMRDCMREASSWQLRRRVGRIVSSVFRAGDAATAVAMYHAACEMSEGGVLAEGGKGARGGGARRARVPGLPAVAQEAPAHQQSAGARKQGNQAPLARGAGLPVGEFAAQACGCRHVRPGRDMVRLALLLGEEDGRVARRGAP